MQRQGGPWDTLHSVSASSDFGSLSKPLHKQRDSFRNLDLRIVAEMLPCPGNVREGNRHIAGLRRLAVDGRLLAQTFLQQFDQLVQRDSLRLAQVEDFIAEFLLRAGHDALHGIGHISVIAGSRTVAEDWNRFAGADEFRKLVHRQIGPLPRAVHRKKTQAHDPQVVQITYPGRDNAFVFTLASGDYVLKAYFDGKPVGDREKASA